MDDQSIESEDEDQKVVQHLSPQTLLETPGDSVQYSYRSPEGTVTYRVLQVDAAPENIVSTGSNFSNAGVPQVLTGNLNGQLFVIGNPGDVFTNQGGRTIAPRVSIGETSAVTANMKKRDERRRATHNEVERRRRDKINYWITKLSKIIPETLTPEIKGNGHYEGQSKGGILAKACEYIQELSKDRQKMENGTKENKQLLQNLEMLKQQNATLKKENRILHDIIKRNGLEVEISKDVLS